MTSSRRFADKLALSLGRSEQAVRNQFAPARAMPPSGQCRRAGAILFPWPWQTRPYGPRERRRGIYFGTAMRGTPSGHRRAAVPFHFPGQASPAFGPMEQRRGTLFGGQSSGALRSQRSSAPESAAGRLPAFREREPFLRRAAPSRVYPPAKGEKGDGASDAPSD